MTAPLKIENPLPCVLAVSKHKPLLGVLKRRTGLGLLFLHRNNEREEEGAPPAVGPSWFRRQKKPLR